jgi:hypothetical protein
MPLLESFANASIRGYGAFLPASGGGPAYEHIANVFGNSSSSTITFSSIPQTYKHLQIRWTARITTNTTGEQIYFRTNSITSNYAWHSLVGSGTSVYSQNAFSSGFIQSGIETIPGSQETSTLVGAGIIDISDYTSSKNKTFRTRAGRTSAVSSNVYQVALYSGLSIDTAATTSVSISSGGGNFTSLTRFSLYGIKG